MKQPYKLTFTNHSGQRGPATLIGRHYLDRYCLDDVSLIALAQRDTEPIHIPGVSSACLTWASRRRNASKPKCSAE